MKLATIRDLEAERDRLMGEHQAAVLYLWDVPRHTLDYAAALRSYEVICRQVAELSVVIKTWEQIAENEAVRSPLLDEKGTTA